MFAAKKEIIDRILMRLSSVYTPETEVYQRTQKALLKLTVIELDWLRIMVATTVTRWKEGQ